ncbi:MAG TPA: sulfite exporter TauE/SafE family protein [Hyphomicrobiaceae bacterium]|nr:sulfite exporter TauE/SafE family protein [Hyphomicrobiaceae bacterium]
MISLSLWQIGLIAVTAFGAQVVGGLAGYGTGLLMPLVLVPMIGAEAVVPIISVSSIITNVTRAIVFRESVDYRRAAIITLAALPTTLAGAWCYTLLSSRGATLVIAGVLLAVVILRRWIAALDMRISDRGTAAAGVAYGFLTGGSTGVGVILLSILMAAGLSGTQVIATDALVTIVLGIAKSGVFAAAGVLSRDILLIAVLVGAMATPGTLLARYLAKEMSLKLHDLMIEIAIVVGALVLIWRALMS